MRIASLAEVKARLSALVEQARTEGPVVIPRNGKAVAVILAPVVLAKQKYRVLCDHLHTLPKESTSNNAQ